MENHTFKNMSIRASIPGIPGYGPKFPVPNHCRSGTLCLKYKGMDIYIPGKSVGLPNDCNIVKDHKEKINNPNHTFKSSTPSRKTFDCVENKNLTTDTMKSHRSNKDITVSKCHVPAMSNHYNATVKKPLDSLNNTVNNVSAINDIRKTFGSGDCKELHLIKKYNPDLKRGFVKRLIKVFEDMSATSANK